MERLMFVHGVFSDVGVSQIYFNNDTGDATSYACPDGFCKENNQCAEHRSGLLCGQCDEGYPHQSWY